MINPGKEKTIKTRIITAVIALPVLILLVQFSSLLIFNSLILLVSLIGLVEFYNMTLPAERGLERSFAISFGLLFAGFLCWQMFHPAILVLTVIVLLLAIVYLLRFHDLGKVVQHISITLFGLLYVPLLLSHLAMLRNLEDGRAWVFFALIVAMAGDSAAYFVGSALGRRKLYPAISPNKSIEGALGGLAGSIVGAYIFKVFMLPETAGWVVLLMAAVLSVLAQLGDLFESMLKRSCQVKDSGSIIPGHGGILDRLDSLLFVFPAAYYLVLYFG